MSGLDARGMKDGQKLLLEMRGLIMSGLDARGRKD